MSINFLIVIFSVLFRVQLPQGECEIVDFKESLSDKSAFGKSYKNFAPKYDELAKDVVAFANRKG